MKLGKVIRRARREKEISQQELGDKIGVSIVSIRSWEKEYFFPRLHHLFAVMKALDLKIEDFMEKEDLSCKS